MSQAIEVFKNILNPNAEARKAAEQTLEQTKTIPFSDALNFYLEGMKSEDKKISQLAALMFKKTLLDDAKYLNTLSSDVAEKLINEVFYKLVDVQKEWKFLERVAENIARLYTIANLKNSFNQIVDLFNHESPIIRRFAIFLLDSISDLNLIKEDLVQITFDSFKTLFSKGLEDTDPNVRIITLKATTTLLGSISNKTLLMEFSSLASFIVRSLVYCLQNDVDGTKSISCLETLNILVEVHPKLWKEDLESFITVICEILSAPTLSLQIKNSTFQIILSLSKGTPAYLRKSEVFKTKFIPLLLVLLKDLDNLNDLSEWTKLSEESDNDREEMFYSAREGIEILAQDLGQKFLDIINPYIGKMVNSSDWTEVHGGLTCIGWLSEVFQKQFKPEIPNLLEFISFGIGHAHPRVRHSALSALGLFSTSNKPSLQEKYHGIIIPALAKIISNEEENLRVRTQAITSLISFLKGLIDEEDSGEVEDFSDLLKPYSKDLLQLLAKIFNDSLKIDNFQLQETSLSCISLIATILDQEFTPFYNDIMPFLKELLLSLLSQSSASKKQLTATCISTISFICSSVNKNPEPFLNDFNFFCDLFDKLLPTLKEEDPEVIAVFKAYSHISTSMKEGFYPYLEKIFPILSKYISADIDIKLEDVDLEKIDDDVSTKSAPGLILQSEGINKKLSMKTFTLQNKIMALDVLKDICLNMGNSFYPYIDKFLLLVKPLVNILYSRKLRKISVKSFEAAIYACKDEAQQKQIVDFIFPDFLEKLGNDAGIGMIRDIKYTLKVLIFAITEIKSVNVFNQEFVVTLYASLGKVIQFIEKKKSLVRDSIGKEDAYDENDKEGFGEDLEVLNEVNRRVMELSGILYKLYKEQLTDLVNNNLTSLFEQILINAVKTSKDEQELVYSLCFFTDVLNYSSIETFRKYFIYFIENSLAYKTKNFDILQNVVFGFGIIAERTTPEEYQQVAGVISDTISSLITAKVTEDSQTCFDNAIASLGKVLYFKTQTTDEGSKLAERFLLMLPLKHDFEESNSSLALLCRHFLQNHPLIHDQRNFLQIKAIFNKAAELNKDNDFITADTKILIDQALSAIGN